MVAGMRGSKESNRKGGGGRKGRKRERVECGWNQGSTHPRGDKIKDLNFGFSSLRAPPHTSRDGTGLDGARRSTRSEAPTGWVRLGLGLGSVPEMSVGEGKGEGRPRGAHARRAGSGRPPPAGEGPRVRPGARAGRRGGARPRLLARGA